jgi:hypothetical protein
MLPDLIDQHNAALAAAAQPWGMQQQQQQPNMMGNGGMNGMNGNMYRTSTQGSPLYGNGMANGADALAEAAAAIAAQDEAAAAAAAAQPVSPQAAGSGFDPAYAAAAAAPAPVDPVRKSPEQRENLSKFNDHALKLSDELEMLQKLISDSAGAAAAGNTSSLSPSPGVPMHSPAAQSPAAQPAAAAAAAAGGGGAAGFGWSEAEAGANKQPAQPTPISPGAAGDVKARRPDQGLFL